ncbi:MAG: DegT/DnrJ/EryC1/StrS aminotransferase family protein [Bdellovibrionaceae bacterium]|nr:DegT/DnrJ/EryC1/StrS aminotransferase family protein [Pseudobdellovibrionaceae bacterium]
MKDYIYPLSYDCFGDEEKNAAIEVLNSGKYTLGEKTKEFESAFAKFVGAKHAIMVNSGSSANLLLVNTLLMRAFASAQLKAGDEIIVPALSWPTTVWPIAQLGLTPVFVDIDPKTMAISTDSAKKALSNKTKAMFLIHVMGLTADMESIINFCEEHNLILLEDCCESLGCYSDHKHVGNFGWGGTFSHFFSHHLTTIEGGTIVTNDDALADDLRSLRSHGWTRDRKDKNKFDIHPNIDPRFCFVTTGYNVRPMEIQAAIGLVQLKKLQQNLKKRNVLYKNILQLIKEKSDFLYVFGEDNIDHLNLDHPNICPMNICLFDRTKKMLAKDIQSIFESHSIETRPIIAGNLTQHPAIKKISFKATVDLNFSETLFKYGFMIGCHPNTGDEALTALSHALRELSVH